MKQDSEKEPEEADSKNGGGGTLRTIVVGILLFALFEVMHQFGCAPRDLKG